MNTERQEKMQADTPICPLCGEPVDTGKDTALTFIYLRQVYQFCCPACQNHFARTPEKFIVQLAHEEVGHMNYPCPRYSTDLDAGTGKSTPVTEDRRTVSYA